MQPSARRIALQTAVVNVITVCALLCGGEANAHPEFSPVTTNRYLKLDLIAPDQARLAYTLMFGAAPAYSERKRSDANADGQLDAGETRALGERLRADVLAHLKLTVDGQPATPSFEPATVGLAGPEVGPSPFSVDLIARIHFPSAAPHTLILDDQTEVPQLGESEVRVEESLLTRLLESHRGAPSAAGDAASRESRILFRGPRFSALEDRSVTVRFEGSARVDHHDAGSDGRMSLRATLVGVAALAVIALLGFVVVRVRRRYRSMNG